MGLTIEVRDEEETARGWSYALDVVNGEGGGAGGADGGGGVGGVGAQRVRVNLSFVDHDHLSGGAVPPHRVVLAVVRALAEARGVAGLPSMFDVSTARRMVPDLEERMRGRM